MDITTALKQLKESNDSQVLIEAIYSIANEGNIDSQSVLLLAGFIKSNDRGVKDAAVRVLSELKEDNASFASQLLAPYILDENIEIRNLAGDILIRIGAPAAKYLVNYLNNSDHDVRKFACDILGLLDTREYANDIKPLLKDKDENVVQSAIEALGNYQDATCVASLIEIYNKMPEQKPNVIEALGKIGSKESIDYLLDYLSSENDEFLKTTIIDALSINCDDIEVARKLFDKIEEMGETIQTIILKTVSAIAFRLGETIELPQRLRYLSYKALFDDDDDIRAAGLLALGNIYTTDDFPSIFNEIFKNNPDTQSLVLERLLTYNNPEVVKQFFKMLCNEVAARATVSCDIDFLSLLVYMWEFLSADSRASTIDALISSILECRTSDHEEIFELLSKLDMNLTVEKLLLNYSNSSTEQKEIIEELARKYNFDLTITNN